MASQARMYTVDDVWRLEQHPIHPAAKYYLIDGELYVKIAPGESHDDIAAKLAAHLFLFVDAANLGQVSTNAAYHPPSDRDETLAPAVSFISQEVTLAPYFERSHLAVMPDLAVEIISPSQTLAETRRKAEVYLRHGATMVWLVHPAAKNAEEWTVADDGAPQNETIDLDGELSGGTVLPGFTLPLERLFPV